MPIAKNSPRTRLATLALGLPLVLALAGCATDGIKLGNLDPSAITKNLFGADDSTRYPHHAKDMPLHVEAVLAAAAMRLRGRAPEQVVSELGVRGSERFAPEPGFDFAGFAVRDIEIVEYTAPDDPPLAQRIVGNLHFADGYRRRASVGFDIAYRIIDPSPLEVTWARLTPALTRATKATLYVLPAAAANKALSEAKSYGELYSAVVTSALPLRTGAVPAGAQDYVILVFFEDRLAPGDSVQVGVSKVREGPQSHTAATHYLAFKGGWVVAVLPGRFAFGGEEPFWIKAVHTIASDSGGKPVVVGLFSSDPAAALSN